MSSPSEKTIALIVVTHNSARWLHGFADSWNRTAGEAGAAQSGGIELLAVDCASTDHSISLLQSLMPGILIQKCANIGYGAAVNRAAAASSAPWLLICNPDLTFPPQFLTTFFKFQSQRDSAGSTQPFACIAPRLMNEDGSLQPSTGAFPSLRSLIRDQLRPRHLRKYLSPQPTTTREVDWASGACLFIRRQAFQSIGGFDERYFLYMEEVDLQRRLRDNGHPTLFLPDLTLTHHNPNAQRSPQPAIQRYAARGLLRYFAKHAPLALNAYRLLALVSGRLPPNEALASRKSILKQPTGP